MYGSDYSVPERQIVQTVKDQLPAGEVQGRTGRVTMLYEAGMGDTGQYAFVRTHSKLDTKNGAHCKVWTHAPLWWGRLGREGQMGNLCTLCPVLLKLL